MCIRDSYGAYVLRNSEANLLTRSLLIGVAFFASLAITPLIINFFTPSTAIDSDSGGFVYTPTDIIPDEIPVVVQPITPPRIIENTVKLDIPTHVSYTHLDVYKRQI